MSDTHAKSPLLAVASHPALIAPAFWEQGGTGWVLPKDAAPLVLKSDNGAAFVAEAMQRGGLASHRRACCSTMSCVRRGAGLYSDARCLGERSSRGVGLGQRAGRTGIRDHAVPHARCAARPEEQWPQRSAPGASCARGARRSFAVKEATSATYSVRKSGIDSVGSTRVVAVIRPGDQGDGQSHDSPGRFFTTGRIARSSDPEPNS